MFHGVTALTLHGCITLNIYSYYQRHAGVVIAIKRLINYSLLV